MSRERYFAGQRYSRLRKACAKRSQLFVDTAFPPTNASLFLDQERSSEIVWKRPAELADDPHLFVEGASANDVTQGILGNCWFVSACSALTHNQALLDKVIPNAEDQEWGPGKAYTGIFRFRFWRYGDWVEVVIDDLLPTRDGKLLFARSKTPNEFWSALLEKAFAKLYGCYENLVGGQLSDALQDVSGGVAETINVGKFLRDDPLDKDKKLFETLRQSFDHQSLIVAAIAAKTKEEIEKTLDCGLVKGHAYAVTAVRYVTLDAAKNRFGVLTHEKQMLIRLQNPWGEKEWNGAWSDGSKEWEQVTQQQKRELGITVDEDGEFWMPWDDFVRYFTDISMCGLFNTSIFSLSKRFHEAHFYAEWTTNGAKSGAPNDLAGGCLNFAATFCSNPQYAFDITSPDNEVMFALTQREECEGSKKREPWVTIGMHIMRVENNRRFRVHQRTEPVATSDYANARSAFLHVRNLRVGRYIVLPTTFAPREQAKFLLRIFSRPDCRPRPLLRHAPRKPIWTCKKIATVTRIQVKRADINADRPMSTYCILYSNGEKARTPTVMDTNRPAWQDCFVFHRDTLRQQYALEVWEDRSFKDKLIGRCTFNSLIDNDSCDMELELLDGKKAGEKIGRLFINVSAYDDPMYL